MWEEIASSLPDKQGWRGWKSKPQRAVSSKNRTKYSQTSQSSSCHTSKDYRPMLQVEELRFGVKITHPRSYNQAGLMVQALPITPPCFFVLSSSGPGGEYGAGGSGPWSLFFSGGWKLPPYTASASYESQANQSVAKANALYGEKKMLSELIRFPSPTLSLPLKQARSVHSLPLSNLGKVFEIPICPAPQPVMFLVTG